MFFKAEVTFTPLSPYNPEVRFTFLGAGTAAGILLLQFSN
jgi:hypothetical protein